jgi:hypothetical protein
MQAKCGRTVPFSECDFAATLLLSLSAAALCLRFGFSFAALRLDLRQL